jgi:hypothetical protein
MKQFNDYLEIATESATITKLNKNNKIKELINLVKNYAGKDNTGRSKSNPTAIELLSKNEDKIFIWINTYKGERSGIDMWKTLQEHDPNGLGYTDDWTNNFNSKIKQMASVTIKKVRIPLINPNNNGEKIDNILVFKGTFSELLDLL